jgi:hypothetical protein
MAVWWGGRGRVGGRWPVCGVRACHRRSLPRQGAASVQRHDPTGRRRQRPTAGCTCCAGWPPPAPPLVRRAGRSMDHHPIPRQRPHVIAGRGAKIATARARPALRRGAASTRASRRGSPTAAPPPLPLSHLVLAHARRRVGDQPRQDGGRHGRRARRVGRAARSEEHCVGNDGRIALDDVERGGAAGEGGGGVAGGRGAEGGGGAGLGHRPAGRREADRPGRRGGGDGAHSVRRCSGLAEKERKSGGVVAA